MSETTGTETTADTAATEPDQPTSEPVEVEQEKGKGPGAEAARYRTQLRAAEAQRDALAARVDALHRASVERLAGEHLAVAGDVWSVGGAELADLLDDGGDVDPTRVAALVTDLVAARPGLGRDAGPRRLDLGQGRREAAAGGASWQGLLQGRG